MFSQTTRFAVIGDFGANTQPEADVATLVKCWNPEFIITLGDNNYENGEAATIDLNIGQYYREFIFPYAGAYGTGSVANQFFPCLGNHDWNTTNATPYLNYFTLPGNERYYDFVKGPVHFFAIDSDPHEPDGTSSVSPQAIWLRNALADASEQWKIVYFHHPPYTSGTRHGSTLAMRWPFKQWGATAVFSGHEHIYERLIEDSIVYVVNGLGGKSLYPLGAPIAGSLVRYNADYGAMLVDADADSIRLQFITRAEIIVDSYTIHIPPSSVSMELTSGWNLVSLPLTVPDDSVTALFPTATSEAFRYDVGGYVPSQTLQPGVGYWLRFNADQSVELFGSPLHQDTIDVEPGWNLIGSSTKPIATTDIVMDPQDNLLSRFFNFDGTYIDVDSLLPGKGYWVKINQTGKFIIIPPSRFSEH